MSEEEVTEAPEYEFDLDKLKEVKHNWVRRGIVVSCENAGHPSHRHFLVNKKVVTDSLPK